MSEAAIPQYMQQEWFALLRARCAHTPRARVAQQLGVSAPTLSQVLNGSGLYGTGQASTQRVAERVTHAFGRYPCPYLSAEAGWAEQWVSVVQCRAYAHRPAPTSSPREARPRKVIALAVVPSVGGKHV